MSIYSTDFLIPPPSQQQIKNIMSQATTSSNYNKLPKMMTINVHCKDTTELDCERIRLAPLLKTPCVKVNKNIDGGQLRNGSYQAYVAYVVNDQKVTDYIGVSNVQALFHHDINGGSLDIEVTNLDKEEFEQYELVILYDNQGAKVGTKIGTYSTEQNKITLDFIDPALPVIQLSLLVLSSPAYEKSESMYVVNDYLIRQGPTEQFDFNYRQLMVELNKARGIVSLQMGFDDKGNAAFVTEQKARAIFERFPGFLERVGFTIDEIEQSRNLIFATYESPDESVWDSIWGDDVRKLPLEPGQYQLMVAESSTGGTSITWLDSEGETLEPGTLSDTLQVILAMLKERGLDVQ